MMDIATLGVRRLADVAAAEIHGVDLTQPLAPALKDAIMAAFLEHRLLVFRGQHLTKDQQYALTLNFGEIEEHVARLGLGAASGRPSWR